jgi:hypothetical protein
MAARLDPHPRLLSNRELRAGSLERDEVAEALAQPADAQVVLDAIRAAEKAEDGDETGGSSIEPTVAP